ncbi:MAG: integrin alpha [Sumerlaeia bacterium]
MNGANDGDRSGFRVSGAGDVNGDGLADVLVSAPYSSPNGLQYAGQCFIIFGKKQRLRFLSLQFATGLAASALMEWRGID